MMTMIEVSLAALQSLKILVITDAEKANSSLLSCVQAMNIAVDGFNDNENLLPGYRIEPEFKYPKGVYGHSFGRHFLNFFDKTEGHLFWTNDTLVSPIFIGPSVGCRGVLPMVKHFKTFQFSPG